MGQDISMKRRRGRPSATAQANQEELLKVALNLFAKNGFEGTNIKTIASEAGVAGSLFYHHYKNKEGLWKAAMLALSKKMTLEIAAGEKLFRDLDALNFLKAWMRQFIYFSAKHPEFHQIISYELAHASERADWLLSQILMPLHATVKQQLNTLQAEGLIKQIPIANFISIAIGAANIFFIQAYQMKKLYDVDVFDEAEIARHADVVNELFFKGILVVS